MGILSKINRGRAKAEKELAEEYKKELEGFIADYKELSKKRGIDIAPALQVNETGITPVIKFVKVNKQVEVEKK